MAEALGVASGVIAVVDMSTKVLKLCSQYAREVKNAPDDIENLGKEVAGFQSTTQKLRTLLKGPRGKALEASQAVSSAVNDAHSTLAALTRELEPSTTRKAMSRIGVRALKWPLQKKDVEERLQRLARCGGSISLALNVDQTVLIQSVDDNIVIDKLPVAEGASFDSHAEQHSPTCLPNTRVALLKCISQWIEDPNSRTIFWLNGMAGTGKSTIARTVARARSDCGDLGGSFFFKRGEADRGSLTKVMPTLAHQLAIRTLGAKPHIKTAIDTDPSICVKNAREQFEKLIRDPLLKAMEVAKLSSRVVVVIDALDECDEDKDVQLLIDILSRTTALRHRLRVFVTSRPELPIRLGFNRVRDTYQDVLLHEIPTLIVEKDIETYLAEEFCKIRKDFNDDPANVGEELTPGWPGDEALRELTQMAVPLFIFAATLCRFINDFNCGSPMTQLRKVQDHNRSSHGSQLDGTYKPVLMSQLSEGLSRRDKDQIIRDFKDVVGTIVTLANPLSAKSLSRLINTDLDIVKTRLRALHSVLSVPSDDSPVRLFHLSFRDYLVDPDQKQNEFWVDQRAANQTLARNCLRMMAGRLRENMCGMSYPGMRRSGVDSQRITEALPPEVQYACRFWAHHWTAADFGEDNGLAVYRFLKEHLLHWLEAMSLLGYAGEVISAIRRTASWIEDFQPLAGFLADTIRFVKANFTTIDQTPLQLYSSALAFTPRQSIVRSTFEKCIPSWLSMKPQVEGDWDACLAVLEGHDESVTSVVFSHDSKMVASASDDRTVRIWDAESGECVRVLKGHGDEVTSVVFSHDSKMVASASYDKTVRIWDAGSGECVRVLKGHDESVSSVVFSHDSKMVASASVDKTVRIWNAESGECGRVLKGHESWVNSVVFSHDSKMVASASRDETVRIWNAGSGECVRVLKGHDRSVTSVVFSHDSKMVVSASRDETVRIWNAESGDCVRVLKGHDKWVTSVVFSHDSKMVASASDDKTVRIWNAESGECVRILKGHDRSVSSVVFSHDSKIVASASRDETVRIWNAGSGDWVRVLKGHDKWVTSVVFSHDSKMVASASDDKTVRIWDAGSGECVRVLKGHGDEVTSVVFSHDSKMVASASDDKTVRIWDAGSGECVRVLKGHGDEVTSVVFSHDSKMVASASDDKTVRIWDAGSGECVRVLKGHDESVSSVVFSHDSKMVASASYDKTVRIWDAGSGECMKVIQTESIPSIFWFTAEDDGIITNTGLIPITPKTYTHATTPSSSAVPRLGVRNSSWITVEEEDWLRLPAECRSGEVAVSATTVVIGCRSGRIVIIGTLLAGSVE